VRKALVASASLALVLLGASSAHAAIDASFANRTLTVSGAETAGEITVTCVSDSAVVSGQDADVACDAVERLEIYGAGGGDDMLIGGPDWDFCASGPGNDVNRSC
jgi:hypothetical protein